MKNKIAIILIFVLLTFPSIPLLDAANNQITNDIETSLKIMDNLEKNSIISSRQKSISEQTNLSLIVSSGSGRGFFFPPRVGRKKFFCFVAIIIYTSLFSTTVIGDKINEIGNETYDGPQVLFFIGIGRVWYTKHIILRDDISLLGVGFGKVIFNIF